MPRENRVASRALLLPGRGYLRQVAQRCLVEKECADGEYQQGKDDKAASKISGSHHDCVFRRRAASSSVT
jgi:hypothetical protein